MELLRLDTLLRFLELALAVTMGAYRCWDGGDMMGWGNSYRKRAEIALMDLS